MSKAYSIGTNSVGYDIDDPIQNKFFQNTNFCLCLQKYFRDVFSIQTTIIQQKSFENPQDTDASSGNYRIHVLNTSPNVMKTETIISDFIKKLFETVKTETYTDEKFKNWLQPPSIRINNLKCLQKIMDENVHNVFTVCEKNNEQSLKISYLARELCSVPKSDEINEILYGKILQETIFLPSQFEKSKPIKIEIDKIVANEQISVSPCYKTLNSQILQNKIILFGYYEIVNQLKKELSDTIERYQLITFELNSFDASQIEFLVKAPWILRKIEEKYEEFAVKLQLRSNNFIAPQYLKDAIESDIRQILSDLLTTRFKTIELPKNIADFAVKRLTSIAHATHCYIKTKCKCRSRCYTIPHTLVSDMQVSKSMTRQSELFLGSQDVLSRIFLANGSIEIRTGDIALQKVDTIVISSTLNGLREGVIERAGKFDYEHTYKDTMDVTFTETNGGQLSCKQILFSNWSPWTIVNDDNELIKSIEIFISKSVEYSIKDQNLLSIAFVVPDSCTNETVLAQTMISAAKQQLESNKLQLKISFILLPEQQTLRNTFFTLLGTAHDTHAQFDWPTTVIKITLMAFDAEHLRKCENKINNYLKRCITTIKFTNSEGIYQHWDQHSINAFYKYCKDRCVLPQTHQDKTELELTGSVNNVLEVKQKWHCLSDLMKEKVLRRQKSERPSSARPTTGASSTQTKLYNIMLSYSEKDIKKCSCLLHRLIDEGFSVWAEPIMIEQTRDVLSQINRSDCIILCISESYYESKIAEKEARYAYETGKQVFLVKIENDPLIDWQRQVFDGKLFFHLFGSENHFDLEFGKLLLEMLRYTKPGYISRLQQISGRLQIDISESQKQLTVEERQSIYNEKIRTLLQIGHIEETEMKILIKQVKNIINEFNRIECESDEKNETTTDNQWNNPNTLDDCEWLERWLKKSTNVTKQNLPPFSTSGDINDAIFPMPEHILKNLNKKDRSCSITQSSPIKFKIIFESDIIIRSIELPFVRPLFNRIPVDEEGVYGRSKMKLETFDGLSQIFPCRNSINRHKSEKPMGLPLLEVSQVAPLSNNKMKKLSNIDYEDNTKEAQSFMRKRGRLTRQEKVVYMKKFVQQTNENIILFDKFCASIANLS